MGAAVLFDERRLRLIRHESGHGRWQLARYMPHPTLRPYLIEIEGYFETPGPPVRRREMPNGNVVLIINFGPDWLIGGDTGGRRLERFSSFIGGVDDAFTVSESSGGAHCMQVNFTPLGARLFLRASARELAHRVVGFCDVLGAEGGLLAERLYHAGDWRTRCAMVEAEIAARILPDAPPRDLSAFVWKRIVDSNGAIAIRDLASECGVSRKHLSVSFRDATGMAPKPYARVCRFQKAAGILSSPTTPAWSDVALDCGYSDQAHFNRDFRRFSGYTPSEYRAHALFDGTGILDA